MCPKFSRGFNKNLDMAQNGRGKIVCERVLQKTRITEISHDYPLRLMKPKSHSDDHEAVYVLSYGGGLLNNDLIEMNVTVNQDSMLSIHSQASTKVYKRSDDGHASQTMRCIVKDNSLLAILPEPVTCFANSSYVQSQVFELQQSSSLILLDWVTSGRTSRGECWQFDRFQSENRIYVDGDLVIRDAWLLDSTAADLRERMDPYQCTANVILLGPKLAEAIEYTIQNHKKHVIYRQNTTIQVPLLWSLSKFEKQGMVGVVIRAASVDTIIMRQFLFQQLHLIPPSILGYFSRI